MSAFFQWMKAHRQALIVSCVMFGVMATCMAESLLSDEAWSTGFFETFGGLTVWIWRLGGAVTWPVFMWLLLRPYLGKAPDGNKALGVVCAIAALYGGFGLWAAYKLFEVMVTAVDNGAVFITPLVMAVGMMLPFAYVWGFVILYGCGRSRLMQRPDDYGWLGNSAIATVVGLYIIGALIYLAMLFVAMPLSLVTSPLFALGAEEVALHVVVDVLAIAVSTGNFASQWWAFYKVDEYFDQPIVAEQPAMYAPQAAALPRLYCTCGQELTLDESRLPNYVAKESYCPHCGARIAH